MHFYLPPQTSYLSEANEMIRYIHFYSHECI